MKKTVLTLMTLMAAFGAMAAPLTPEQALQRLDGDSNCRRVLGRTARQTVSAPVFTATTPSERPAVYIFNRGNNHGYMIVSADDTAAPLLGYSDEGVFNADLMPEAMRWWLDEYARRIDFAERNGVPAYTARAEVPEGRTAIEPMTKTRWDQVEPYNQMCPMSGANRTYTGCVATSMAQVMKYWQYPEVGQGKISYTDQNLGKQLTMNFSSRPFDWENMLDGYSDTYTPEEADAVAYLMRACGFSVKMNFSDQASSAYALYVADALVKYFNYDGNARYEVRSLYAPAEWDAMMYDNLKNVGPIICGGSSMMGGGHSFICDGYDGEGYYHFNWGWSGMSNGYFLLDALNPASLGSGGGLGGGYNFSQDAVFGIRPPTGEPVVSRPMEIVQGGSLAGIVEDGVLTFYLTAEESGSWLNYNPSKLTVEFGATFEPQNGTPGETFTRPIDHRALTLNAGFGTAGGFIPTIDLTSLDLADGTYKVTFVTNIQEDESAEWVPVHPLYGYSNYITITREGDNYTVNTESYPELRIVEGRIEGDLYYGCVAKVTVTVTNDTDVELSRGFAPALFYQREGQDEPTLHFLGGSELLTVAPHSTVEHSWYTEFTATELILGMYTEAEMFLTFFDEATYNFYNEEFFQPVTMKPNPGLPEVAISGFNIPGAQTSTERVGLNRLKVYTVGDRLAIPVEFTAKLTGDVPFGYRMLACLIDSQVGEDGSTPIYGFSGEPVMLTQDGETFDFTTSVAYPAMQPGHLYMMVVAYLYGGSNFLPIDNQMYGIRYADPASIDDIEIGVPATDAPIYNLQGIFMGYDLNALPAGLYVRDGQKIYKR